MAKWLITWSLKNSCFLPKMVIWSFLGENSYFLTFNFSLIKPICHLYTSKLSNLGGLGRLKGAKKVQKAHRNSEKWQKHPILARFWQFLKKPMRDLYENVVKCSFWRARFTGAIRFDVQFRRDLSRKKSRGASTIFPGFFCLLPPLSPFSDEIQY